LETIELASNLCTQKTFPALFKACKKILPTFFGFESFGLLLEDPSIGELFTVEEEKKADASGENIHNTI
jgi:hypothetical protein